MSEHMGAHPCINNLNFERLEIMTTHNLPRGTMAMALMAALPPGTTVEKEVDRSFINDLHDIPEGKVIFEGNVRDRTEVAAELDKRQIINHGTAYLDPQDIISDTLPSSAARAAFTSSIVWTITGKIVNATTNVYYSMRDAAKAVGNIDNHNEFAAAIAEKQANEQFVKGLGYDEYAQGLSAIGAYDALRQQWISVAESAGRSAGVKFTPPELMDSRGSKGMMEQPPQFDDATWEKEKFAVRFVGQATGLTEDEIGATLVGAKKRQADEYASRVKAHSAIVPALRAIYHAATTSTKDIHFWQLSIDQQRSLLESIQRSAVKAQQSWVTRRDIPITDYIMALPQLKMLVARLEEVLTSSKFKTAD